MIDYFSQLNSYCCSKLFCFLVFDAFKGFAHMNRETIMLIGTGVTSVMTPLTGSFIVRPRAHECSSTDYYRDEDISDQSHISKVGQ